MRVTLQGNRLVVSWWAVKITKREEPLDADGLGSGTRILRDLESKEYCRTIPLPDETRVHPPLIDPNSTHAHHDLSQLEEIRAARDGRHLVLTYPNISTSRASPVVHDGL